MLFKGLGCLKNKKEAFKYFDESKKKGCNKIDKFLNKQERIKENENRKSGSNINSKKELLQKSQILTAKHDSKPKSMIGMILESGYAISVKDSSNNSYMNQANSNTNSMKITQSSVKDTVSPNQSLPIQNKEYSTNSRTNQSKGAISFGSKTDNRDRTRSRKNEAISSNKSSPIKNKEYSANGRTSQSNGIIAN